MSNADLIKVIGGIAENISDNPVIISMVEDFVKKRQFNKVIPLMENLLETGVTTSILNKYYVQSLIDTGQLGIAAKRVSGFLKGIQAGDVQLLEFKGLQGRIAKQRYANAAVIGEEDPADLSTAIDRYLTTYDADPTKPAWHGINVVALLSRAERDGIEHPAVPRRIELAQEIYNQMEVLWKEGNASHWDCATACEASLALENRPNAELWLYRYTHHPDTPPFAIASTLRQFREIWQLDLDKEPGSSLLPILDRKLAENGQLQMTIQDAREGTTKINFEKVFGKNPFISIAKYQAGLERAKAVARVEDLDGDPYGTGFILPGCELGERFAQYPSLFVTNAHVVSDCQSDKALSPGNAQYAFWGLTSNTSDANPFRTRGNLLWSSPSDNLDISIIALETVPETSPYQVSHNLPAPGPDSKVYAIGYPSGGGLSFSLFDSQLLAVEKDGHRIHYRTPTENGSSGSPIFNQSWELIAVHHAGDADMPKIEGIGTYEANEGIRIGAIKEALK